MFLGYSRSWPPRQAAGHRVPPPAWLPVRGSPQRPGRPTPNHGAACFPYEMKSGTAHASLKNRLPSVAEGGASPWEPRPLDFAVIYDRIAALYDGQMSYLTGTTI